ncbi:MAG TPA: HsmA family protein [Rectinemataceae bacterium]|nr:HsmA family protein [Rectinemataceae bacterium]
MLVFAIIFITAALVFYSTAVWWEKATRLLRGKHLLLFWLGLICDTTGTNLMGRLAGGILQPSFHGVTGMLAIVLMLIHAVWATVVHANPRPEPKAQFHRYSVVVWAVWLVPYLSGMIFGTAT